MEIAEDSRMLRDSNAHERVGIELYLNKGMKKRVVETKRAHVQAVLSEQSRQRQQDIHDIEELSSVSKETSWTGERAHILATGYWLQYLFETYE